MSIASAEEIIDELESIESQETLKVADLVDYVGNKGIGFFTFLIGLFSFGPAGAIPGIDMAIGLMLILTAVQLYLGGGKPYLPKLISERTIKRKTFKKVLRWAKGPARTVDKVAGSRYHVVFDTIPDLVFPTAILLLGIFTLSFALVPFAVMLPASITIIISLAHILKDGILLLLGYFLALMLPAVSLIFIL